MAELLSTLAEATLVGGMSIKLEAISPTTGAAITGVTATLVGIYCETPSPPDAPPEVPEQQTPLFVPIPQE